MIECEPSVGLPDFNSLRNGISLSKDNSEVFTTGITWGTAMLPPLSVIFSGKQLNNDFNTVFCNTVERLLWKNKFTNTSLAADQSYCRAERLQAMICVASWGFCCKYANKKSISLLNKPCSLLLFKQCDYWTISSHYHCSH